MLDVILIGLGVSIDAMCVAITLGLTAPSYSRKNAFITAVYFGIFQMLMPLIGSLVGAGVRVYVDMFAHYISFIILAFLGIRTVIESGKPKDVNSGAVTHKRLLTLAVATSLDALAVGISFAFMQVPRLSSCIIIGLITFVICLAAGLLGSRLPLNSQKNAEILGGIVLIGIGVRILFEGVIG